MVLTRSWLVKMTFLFHGTDIHLLLLQGIHVVSATGLALTLTPRNFKARNFIETNASRRWEGASMAAIVGVGIFAMLWAF